VAPNLAKDGIRLHREVGVRTWYTYFGMENPVVGGYEPQQVALRRAIALALDTDEELRLVYKGEGQPALTLVPPACYGFDTSLRHGMGRADTAAANALLDLHGYRRGADGWRTRPDGQPLVLLRGFSPNQRSRAQAELWTKRLRAVGLRIEVLFAPFGELIKQSLAGKLMMWGFIWTAPEPDGDFYLGLAYGPNAAQSNDARFRLPAYDRLYEQQRVLPDGPERLALMRECQRLMIAHQPYIAHHHPYRTDLLAPGFNGFRRHPFRRDLWRYAGFN
jgi:ABC-type transport system substrate-binding protein